MCCNLQTHVIVISIVSISLTVVTGLSIGISLPLRGGVAIGVHILVHFVLLVSGILCLIGALKNNKCLLIPFIIVEGLKILACIVGLGFCIFQATQRGDWQGFLLMMFGPPLMIELGLTIYFLTIGNKFYQELSSRVVGGRTEGFVLQPYRQLEENSPPLQAGGGVSTVYDPAITQNLTYAYQQQPTSYAQTQQERPQHINFNIKNPA